MPTLTSPVRIWNTATGVYKLPDGCQVKYSGATNDTHATITGDGILIVVTYKENDAIERKQFYIFHGSTGTNRYFYDGYSTETGGGITHIDIKNVLTNISSYVKNQLDYATSNTTYALSAYQGYILNTTKENSSNKVVTISSTSTDTEYPSAKAVYEYIDTMITSAIGGSY